MSGQRDGGTTTNLEEIFLSRAFGQAPTRRSAVDGRFEQIAGAPQRNEVVVGEARPLEDIFLSASFGRPRAVAPPRRPATSPELLDAHDAVITPLHHPRGAVWSESTRSRAIAAVSGVAAAALVVTGVASGGGRAVRPTVSAQGQRVSPRPQQGGGAPGGSSPTQPPITNVAARSGPAVVLSGTDGGVPVTSSGGPTAVPASTVSLAVGTPAGTAAAPSAVLKGDSTSSGGSGGSPAPTPPTPPSEPLAPVVTSVAATVSGLGTTVTSTVTRIENAVPPLSPVTAVLGTAGTTLSSVGHAMRSPQL